MTDLDHPSSGEPFDLRALIRDVSATCTSPDPAVVAKEVERRIDPADAMTALSQALPVVVYHSGSAARSVPDQACRETHGRIVGGGATPTARPSSKVAGIRDAWSRRLRERVSVGPEQWKFLGDCTAADLDYAAELRDQLARANAARASEYRDLAARLRSTQDPTATVRDLLPAAGGDAA